MEYSLEEVMETVRMSGCGRKLIHETQGLEDKYGIPIINKRISVTPVSLIIEACAQADAPLEIAKTLDKASKDVDIDFIGGYGALSLDKLEAFSAVCSVGLDMIAIPGDTKAQTISAIIADELAIGVVNNKTTGVRLIPVPGKRAGDYVNFGVLLG